MKRSAYIRHDAIVPLGKRPVFVWGYGKTGKFVCRVGINGAGLAVYAGTKGGKKLADVTWDGLVKKLRRKDED